MNEIIEIEIVDRIKLKSEMTKKNYCFLLERNKMKEKWFFKAREKYNYPFYKKKI